MDTTITVALIGTGGTILAAIITAVLTRVLNTKGTDGASRPVPVPANINPNELPDLKNKIIEKSISDALLRGRPPSLIECVRSTQTLLVPEPDKRGHFFGPSTVFFIESPATEKPLLLGYHRIVNPGEPGSPARTGLSILFHSSYYFRVQKVRAPMDCWMDLAEQKPGEAAADFIRLPAGTLIQLFNAPPMHKWNIPQLEGTCEPLGVITRELPTEEKVYTQYLFRTTLRLRDATTIEEVKKFVSSFGTSIHVEPIQNVEPDFFLTSGPSPKTMDYLALRALRDTSNSFRHEMAQFTRGFQIA